MSVLGSDEIKRRADEIFESGYDESCVENASYNLRINGENLIIGGTKYDKDNLYRYDENAGYIKLPRRKISVLSTVEKLNLPGDLCARVGITFSWSRKALIPLFGPQVDPGYNDFFYAVVYNASNENLFLPNEEKLLKMELHTVKGGRVISRPTSGGLREIDREMTDRDSVHDVEREVKTLRKNVEGLSKKVDSNDTRLGEVGSGYRQVVWFGVFLVAAAVFGVVLSFIISREDIIANLASPSRWGWFEWIVVTVLGLFIVGWIATVCAVIIGMFKRNRG